MQQSHSDTLSAAGLARLKATLRTDDPAAEIGAAWGVKEQFRQLLASGSLAEAPRAQDAL